MEASGSSGLMGVEDFGFGRSEPIVMVIPDNKTLFLQSKVFIDILEFKLKFKKIINEIYN